MSSIKRYFATGLLITLPVFFTFYIMFAVVRFIDGIWGKVINFYARKYLGFAIPGLGFILGLVTVLIVGFIATHFIGKRLFRGVERWLLKFPFISQIYPALRQIVSSFLSKDSPAFRKVVLVEYPARGIWSIGFLTSDGFREAREKTGKELVHIFIATTPTPLTGFLILVPKEEVKILNISIEDGIKLVISAGIVRPDYIAVNK